MAFIVLAESVYKRGRWRPARPRRHAAQKEATQDTPGRVCLGWQERQEGGRRSPRWIRAGLRCGSSQRAKAPAYFPERKDAQFLEMKDAFSRHYSWRHHEVSAPAPQDPHTLGAQTATGGHDDGRPLGARVARTPGPESMRVCALCSKRTSSKASGRCRSRWRGRRLRIADPEAARLQLLFALEVRHDHLDGLLDLWRDLAPLLRAAAAAAAAAAPALLQVSEVGQQGHERVCHEPPSDRGTCPGGQSVGRTAACLAVSPLPFFCFGSAPAWSSSSTISTCPFHAARCSGG